MNAPIVGMIVFTCTFLGTLLGMRLRMLLPPPHLSTESGDTIKVGIGLIATMTALVLGLVTASAKSAFDTVDMTVRNAAIDILTLDRLLARYGAETGEIRKDFQRVIVRRIDMIWPRQSLHPIQLEPAQSMTEAEQVVDKIRALTPHDDAQRALQSRAVEIGESLLKARWMVEAGEKESIPIPFLVILLFWLTIIFVSFGLFAPRNLTVLAVLFVCSLSVSSALFLVLELDAPFEGLIKVSPEPLRYAASRFDK